VDPTRSTLTVGRLAGDAGVNVETIRYYERRGLLPRPSRGPAGWRRYDDQALRSVIFVKRAQRLGFTLDEIRELLRLRAGASERACARVRKRAESKLDEIDGKIRDLSAMRRALAELAERCHPDDEGACPLLDALVAESEGGGEKGGAR
jgi:MerR family mercuric resistance operon transcriptional regulator